MAEGDPIPRPPDEAPPPRRRGSWSKGLAFVAMVPLLGFIGGQGRVLWAEWRSLKDDQVSARANAVIGYIGITPNPCMAARPARWVREEDGQTLLWAGYRGEEHKWFRVGLGEVDPRTLSMPIGRDTIRSVDRPLFERVGGLRWARIPDEAPMAGWEGGDAPPVYPIRVLEKVMVVNDRVGDRPFLVAYTPVVSVTSVFEAERQGRPVVMGQSGYFVGYHPVLFDRETQSLWLERGGAMTAIAGPLKGSSLARIARILPMAWGEWRGRHPETRLLVGADRAGWGEDGPAPLAP